MVQEELLFRIARIFWRGLESKRGVNRVAAVGDVICSVYSFPLALIGIICLAGETDWRLFADSWLNFVFLMAIITALSRLDYFFLVELTPGRYADAVGTLEEVILWSAALIMGPTVLWVSILIMVVDFSWGWLRYRDLDNRWNRIRNFMLNVSSVTLSYLIAIEVYRLMGGSIPMPQLSWSVFAVALLATLVKSIVPVFIWSGFILYFRRWLVLRPNPNALGRFDWFFVLAMGIPRIADPFALLAAGLYASMGPGGYLFFAIALVMVGFLTKQLSQAAEQSRQQYQQLEKLEKLSRAILNVSLDASALPGILSEHALTMFPNSLMEIRLYPERTLLREPPDAPPVPTEAWRWLEGQTEAHVYNISNYLPWQDQPPAQVRTPLVLAPILDVESNRSIGGIYISLQQIQVLWKANALNSILPAVRSLAAQIASALHQAEVYCQTIESEKMAQELRLAGQIQASFLPEDVPQLPGWQFSALLKPARETSGDFYDFIPLPDGKFGILIGDVSDKGMGPALYMALCRTLIRTYALEFTMQPEAVISAVNRRILTDTRADLFATVFFAVLDIESGRLVYCNAGHNPPYLFARSGGPEQKLLSRTGMAIGVMEEASWTSGDVSLKPGDVLLLYTDGISDTQNEAGEFIDFEGLMSRIRDHQTDLANDIEDLILSSLKEFMGEAAQFDDLTVMVIKRELSN